MPPGPPVLQTLVAEVYGPDPARRLELASAGEVGAGAAPTASWTWIGTSRSPQPKTALVVDESRRQRRRRVRGRMWRQPCGWPPPAGRAGLLHDPDAREDVPIVRPACRATSERIDGSRARASGWVARLVAIGELTRHEARTRSRQHLSQEPAAGDLRDGRRRGRGGEPGIRHSADEPSHLAAGAAGRVRARASTTRSQPFDTTSTR